MARCSASSPTMARNWPGCTWIRPRAGAASVRLQGASPAGLTLELLEGNAAALAFYRVCGFVETGTHGGRMPGNEAFAVRVQCMRWPGIAP